MPERAETKLGKKEKQTKDRQWGHDKAKQKNKKTGEWYSRCVVGKEQQDNQQDWKQAYSRRNMEKAKKNSPGKTGSVGSNQDLLKWRKNTFENVKKKLNTIEKLNKYYKFKKKV